MRASCRLIGPLVAVLLPCSRVFAASAELLHEGFEGAPGRGIHSLCGGCRHDGRPEISREQAYAGRQSLKVVYAQNRTEIATVRLPTDRDLHIGWALFIPPEFDLQRSGTLAQLIGWQQPCFGGGNYHIRLEQGAWGLNIRNLGLAQSDRVFEKPVLRGGWTRFDIDARFSRGDDGYFNLSISDAGGRRDYRILSATRTYIDCPLGPYFKAGLYGDFAAGSYLYLDDLKVTAKDENDA